MFQGEFWVFFYVCCLLIFFSKSTFSKIISDIPSESNSLGPDQVRHCVGPDLGPNCLQIISADDIKCDQIS